jgi:hypothetical protein
MIRIDFSDLEYGLSVLFAESKESERKEIAKRFLYDLRGLDNCTALDSFIGLLAPVAITGDVPSPLLHDAFKQMVISYSGWSASQLIIQKQKQASREHGKKGGQPKSKFIARDELIVKQFNEIRSRCHSNNEAAQRMVNNNFEDINGKSLSVPQICRIVRNQKKEK